MVINRQRGFTLIEIMVSVSIFALIAAITMTNLVQVGKTGEQVSETQRQLAEIQFALAYMGRDIAQVSNRKIRDQYGDEQHQFKLDGESIAFTRSGWNNLLGQNRSDLQRVEYRLEDEKLQRRYWPQLDQSYTDVHLEQTLLAGVEEMNVKLLTRGNSSYESWPPDLQGQQPEKPVALEMTLEITEFGRIQRIYELTDVML